MTLAPAAWVLWLDDEGRTGAANMAIDQTLLDLADREGLAVLRLYRWDPFCISFGRNEPAARRYDRSRIAALGLNTVRRPTGGRAVWHARELTYAVAAPADRFGTLPAAYRAIHQMIADAVSALGAPATLAAPVPAASLESGACFAAAAGGEVLVGNRKVAGSAQLRQAGALLQHGSLLLQDDQSLIATVSVGAPASGREIPLAAVLGAPVGFARAADAVAAAAQRSWAGRWAETAPDRVVELSLPRVDRFLSDAWTWRR